MKIKATGKNPFYKSTYIKIGDILDALAEAGIDVKQRIEVREGVEYIETFDGTEWTLGARVVTTPDDDPQQYGKALTYAKRQSLTMLFAIAEDEDDAEALVKRESPASRFSARKPAEPTGEPVDVKADAKPASAKPKTTTEKKTAELPDGAPF